MKLVFLGVERAVTPVQHPKNELIIECEIVKIGGVFDEFFDTPIFQHDRGVGWGGHLNLFYC